MNHIFFIAQIHCSQPFGSYATPKQMSMDSAGFLRNYVARGTNVILTQSWAEGNRNYCEMIFCMVKKVLLVMCLHDFFAGSLMVFQSCSGFFQVENLAVSPLGIPGFKVGHANKDTRTHQIAIDLETECNLQWEHSLHFFDVSNKLVLL